MAVSDSRIDGPCLVSDSRNTKAVTGYVSVSAGGVSACDGFCDMGDGAGGVGSGVQAGVGAA